MYYFLFQTPQNDTKGSLHVEQHIERCEPLKDFMCTEAVHITYRKDDKTTFIQIDDDFTVYIDGEVQANIQAVCIIMIIVFIYIYLDLGLIYIDW